MLVIASRGSQLALWQARWVEAKLSALGHACRIQIIRTTGDKITGVPLAQVGGKGLFTKEIEEALLDRRADVAVHSLKDLPTDLPDGLTLAAVPEREDPRDAVVGGKLAELPSGALVGTSSLRRAAQLRHMRQDLAAVREIDRVLRARVVELELATERTVNRLEQVGLARHQVVLYPDRSRIAVVLMAEHMVCRAIAIDVHECEFVGVDVVARSGIAADGEDSRQD